MSAISGKDTIKKLEKHGYCFVRQKGSHARLKHPDNSLKAITVPLHHILKPGLLNQIIKDANLSVDDFIKL